VQPDPRRASLARPPRGRTRAELLLPVRRAAGPTPSFSCTFAARPDPRRTPARPLPSPTALRRPLDRDLVRDQAGLVAAVEEELDRAAAVLAVVERTRVHVHPHELVGARLVEAAAVLDCVLERGGPVVEAVGDRLPQVRRDAADELGPEVAADDVPAEGERQPAGLGAPPLAHVDH